MADSEVFPQGIDFVTIERATYQSLQEDLKVLRQQVLQFKQAKLLADVQINQQTALLNLIYKLQASVDLETIFQITTAEVRQFLQADRVVIFRFIKLGNEYHSGKFVAEDRRLEYDSIMGATLENWDYSQQSFRKYAGGNIEIIADIEQESLSDSQLENFSRWQIKACLMIPILCGQDIWGLLSIHQCQTSRQWQPQEIEWLRLILLYFTQSVQHIQMLRYQQQQTEQLQKLNQQLEFKIQQRVSDWMEVNQALRSEVQKRQKINQQLSLQESRLRHITTHLPGAVFQFTGLDGVWKIDYVSEGIYPLTGITTTEIMQDINCFIKRVHPEDLPSFVDSVTQAVHTSTPWGYEGRLIQPSGKICWWQGKATPTTNEQNEIVFCGILIDITESKRVEESLKNLNEELVLKVSQQSAQYPEKLSESPIILEQIEAGLVEATISLVNFISNNLNLIKNYVDSFLKMSNAEQISGFNSTPKIADLTEKTPLDFFRQDLPQVLNSMKVGIYHIQEIITALQKFPRFDLTERQEVDLHTAIDQTLMLLQNRLQSKLHQPEIQVVKNYGQLPKVNSYLGALNHVILNILINAINRIETRDQTRSLLEIKQNPSIIFITTELIESQKVVKIKIRDNGAGVSENSQPQTFESHFSTKSASQNAGCRMLLRDQIVTELHRGTLECISSAGEGTELMIQVPLC